MKLLCSSWLLALCCCCTVVVAQQMPPVILWKKALGGSKDDVARCVIRTVDNGALIVGSSLSNDGDVIGHHGSSATSDAWVVKLSADGNIEWQKSLGGSANDSFYSVIIAPDGSYLCAGSTSSNDGDVAGNRGGSDVWLVKISRYGGILWQKCLGGSGDDGAVSISRTADGNALVMANTRSSGGDVTGYAGGVDLWALKVNTSNGNIIWQRAFGGSDNDFGMDIEEGLNGEFFMVAEVNSNDGYFGANPNFPLRGKFIRMRADFTLATYVGGDRYSYQSIIRTPTDDLWLGAEANFCTFDHLPKSANLGRTSMFGSGLFGSLQYSRPPCTSGFSYHIQGASSLSVVNETINLYAGSVDSTSAGISLKKRDGIISAFGLAARVAWEKILGGTEDDYFTSAAALSDNEFIVVGHTKSNDGDVSGNHGGYDWWVVKFGKTNTIKGQVFIDYNLSGVRDANEPLAGNVLVESSKRGIKTTSLVYNGFFSNVVDTGTYQTKVISTLPYYNIGVPAVVTNTFNTYNNSVDLTFALQPLGGQRDYRAQLLSTTPFRPGFDATYKLQVVNVGTDTLINRTVTLTKDSRLQFLSSAPTQTSIAANDISWNIPYLGPLDTVNITIHMRLSALTPLSAHITSKAVVDTTGDLNKANNTSISHAIVSGGYDPNDKRESTGDNFSLQDVFDGKHINYTIRFQNTGNDTAFNIFIRDTLDAKLDWTTMEMVSSSHPYRLTITDGNKLEWTFSNIHLVDSVHNEPASHGYISYSIKPISTLAAGDIIQNSASIYFDFNLPVKTNTVLTVIKSGIPPPSPVVTGMLNSYCSNSGVQRAKIANMPAATAGITVKVELGPYLLPVAADSTFSFDPATIGGGTHQLRVVFSNHFGADTLTRIVTIEPAVMPDVNVSANVTTIVNLINAVVITAANATGGGQHPLYTYAKDRDFANILRSESSSPVLVIDPNSLQAGDNWVYVKMKTSSSCYITQFNIDSIKLTLQLPAPPVPIVNGMQASYCNNQGIQKGKLGNYPPAGIGATATVKLDGNQLSLAGDSSFGFNPSTLSIGAHVLEVTFANMTATRTTTVNFTVSALATPDVNVTASISTVMNTNDMVIITASNAAGGGNTPLYTFALTRDFTHIIQPEGQSNTYTIAASSLRLGNNWIYVKMKTSATCYTQQTALDSVMIIKSTSIGLTDPDNPAQRIGCTPNPFRSQLIVSGLMASKRYSITVYNMQGRQVHTSSVTNRSITSIRFSGQPAGVYQVSIYDETKGRMIGTAQVVKQ
ncbi:MAG TPA: T9SS type A sorting domain-containing protein [Chitinophagaceae bacterium]|nr:T9SS type A sorting domain-containing protein [Chitinophagaceae bacterium]